MRWATVLGLGLVVYLLGYLDSIIEEVGEALGGERGPVDRRTGEGAPQDAPTVQADAGLPGYVQQALGYSYVPASAYWIDLNPDRCRDYIAAVDARSRMPGPERLVRQSDVTGVVRLKQQIDNNERVGDPARWDTFARWLGDWRGILEDLYALVRAEQVRMGA